MLSSAQAKPLISDRPCIILLSKNSGDQRELLDTIKYVREALGISSSSCPLIELSWGNPFHRKVIEEALQLKDYQLPLATTGMINSNGMPTVANKNRPALKLKNEVIAYYLINEWGRRTQKGPFYWPYKAPASPKDQQAAVKQAPIDGSLLLLVPAGEFWRGSTEGEIDELPPKKIALESFYLAKTEVTFAQFAKFVSESGYVTDAEKRGFAHVIEKSGSDRKWVKTIGANWRNPNGDGVIPPANHPVRQVSLEDCRQYCSWANLRLPSELEWEKAARGTNGLQYPWGNQWDKARLVRQGLDPQEVGSVPLGASPYGQLDMAGNVREWTDTSYQAYAEGIDIVRDESRYSIRGGSFAESSPPAKMAVRGSFRFNSKMGLANDLTGFRVASDVESSPIGLDAVGPRLAQEARHF